MIAVFDHGPYRFKEPVPGLFKARFERLDKLRKETAKESAKAEKAAAKALNSQQQL